MAGDALMRDGEAIAREGEALMAEGDSGCCCPGGPGPGPCGVNVGPGCDCGVLCCRSDITAQLVRYFPDGTRQVVWSRPQRCCCRQVTQGCGGRRTFQFRQVDFIAGCVVTETTINATAAGPGTLNLVGTVRVISRVPSEGCRLNFDRTDPWSMSASTCAPPHPIPPPNVVGRHWSGFSYSDCQSLVYDLTFDGEPTGDISHRYQAVCRLDPERAECDPSCSRGACCCRGECYSGTTAAECAAMGGVYKGDGSNCLDADCASTGERTRGACCLPSGDCDISSPTWCSQRGGVYQGDGTTCETVTCPPPPEWACCLPNQTCQPLTQSACAKAGGSWRPNTTCAQINCVHEPQGACCLSNGSCVLATSGACGTMGGVYRGDNTDCATSPCTGACCSFGACAITTPQACAGFFLGFGTTCDPNPCGGGGTQQPMLDVGDFVRTGSGAFR